MGGAGLEYSMQTDTLRVKVLPELGGKIASLGWIPSGLELLQPPLAPYGPRSLTMAFDEGDASGIDECLPSVAACQVSTPRGEVAIPDHGDFWRLSWECTQSGNEIHMAAMGVSLPLRFERTLRLEADTLAMEYRVTNTGDAAVDYAWSAHPLFAVEPEDRILLPETVGQVEVEGSAGRRLGGKGSVHTWPHTRTTTGELVDLSIAGAIGDGIGDKLFAASPREGWAALDRVRHKIRIEVHFDPALTPWLGLWICFGGWPEGKANRQQCVAIEPCTAAMDSLTEAIAKGVAKRLEPGESASWPMRIRIAAVS